MEALDYPSLRFVERRGQQNIRAIFKVRYYFDIPYHDLDEMGISFSVQDGVISLEDADKHYKRFDMLVERLFRTQLRHLLNKKRVFYIDRASGVPLIGTNEFGIVDRNTSLLELKPLTGCNYNCTFCSVDEGVNDKTYDYLVDVDYLIEETAKVASLKTHPVEINIGPQGEPLLYPDLTALIRGLRAIPNIYFVSMNSNGSLLSPRLVDELADAGLGRINLSIHTIEPALADKLMGTHTNQQHILKMARRAKDRFEVMLTPVLMKGKNDTDEQMDALVATARTLKNNPPIIAFQNFLRYKSGRNPVKERTFDDFYALLRRAEKRNGTTLIMDAGNFSITQDKVLEKPFRKDMKVKARIIAPGRWPAEVICAHEGRAITVRNCPREKGAITIRIIRDKHNVFTGIPI